MKFVYLDTNIFIYLADKNSLYSLACVELIEQCQKRGIIVGTSVETFQEILHYSKNVGQLMAGIKLCKKVKDLVDEILVVDEKVINKYLQLAGKYKNVKSRDLIHLAVSIKYKAELIITYDKEFKRFKEIKTLNPKEVIRKFN